MKCVRTPFIAVELENGQKACAGCSKAGADVVVGTYRAILKVRLLRTRPSLG